MKKKKMDIGITNQTWADGYYHLNWGKTASAYNRNRKRFKTRTAATKEKNKLAKKYKKQGYKIDYMYMSD